MRVGVLTIELAILEARTLKDKRRVIKGFKDRLRNRFNVSVAEVGFGDAPKRCRLGVVMVSKETRPLHSQLDKIVAFNPESSFSDAVKGLHLYGRKIVRPSSMAGVEITPA